MNYSKEFIKKILESTNIVDLISENGISLTRSGSNFKGICPFHSEKTPSFNVNPLRGYFYCFGCKISGDGIKFLMEFNRFSFKESVEELAKRANIPIEKDYNISNNQMWKKDEGINCLEEAAFYFQKKLSSKDGEFVVKYLLEREVSKEMCKKFSLGASIDEWQGLLNHLKRGKKLVKDIFKAGLIKYSEKSGRYYDAFRARLMFPIKDSHGRCIGFGARSIKSEDKPKYLNSSETFYYQKSQVLYGLFEGLSSIRQSRRVIFVEGYLDVIRLHENGFEEAVATCGTALTHNHLKIIKRYADNVILIFDGDDAGSIAALKYTQLLLSYPVESYVVNLPRGDDPDTFLLMRGKESFEKLLENKISTLDYFVRENLKKFPNSVQGRMQSLEEMLPTILKISDLKRRQFVIIAISEIMRISSEIIVKELQIKSKKDLSKKNINDISSSFSNNTKEYQDEQWLLQSLLRKGELWPRVRDHLSPDEFEVPHYKKLYAKLLEFPDSEFQPFDPLKLEESDPNLFRIVMHLLKEEIGSHDFSLSLRRIKERNLDLHFNELLLKSDSMEEKAKIGLMRRENEEKLKDIKKVFNN